MRLLSHRVGRLALGADVTRHGSAHRCDGAARACAETASDPVHTSPRSRADERTVRTASPSPPFRGRSSTSPRSSRPRRARAQPSTRPRCCASPTLSHCPQLLQRHPGRRGTQQRCAGCSADGQPRRRASPAASSRSASCAFVADDGPAAAGDQRLAPARRPLDRGRLPLARRSGWRVELDGRTVHGTRRRLRARPRPRPSAAGRGLDAGPRSRGGSCATSRGAVEADLSALSHQRTSCHSMTP